MRLSEYLQVGKKMKEARIEAGISQRNMALRLLVSNSAYSNYENGYSEPSAEIILKFCDVLGITLEDLLNVKINPYTSPTVRTFSELIAILIDLDNRGIPVKGHTTYTVQGNQLTAHLTFDIKNAQLATFLPDWNKVNEAVAEGRMSKSDYDMWLEEILRLFNVRIDDFVTGES